MAIFPSSTLQKSHQNSDNKYNKVLEQFGMAIACAKSHDRVEIHGTTVSLDNQNIGSIVVLSGRVMLYAFGRSCALPNAPIEMDKVFEILEGCQATPTSYTITKEFNELLTTSEINDNKLARENANSEDDLSMAMLKLLQKPQGDALVGIDPAAPFRNSSGISSILKSRWDVESSIEGMKFNPSSMLIKP